MTIQTVCYFGAFKPRYPRNGILRQALERQGLRVVMVNAPRRLPTLLKIPRLVWRFWRDAHACDAIIVAEFGQLLVPVAWLLARLRRVPLVVDFFASTYQALVEDRGQVAGGGLTASFYRKVDTLALRLADAALVDTPAHAEYAIEMFGANPEKISVVPVGVPETWFTLTQKSQPATDGRLLVQFYGTYIPLHGIETILRAAHLLRANTSLRLELIGQGQTYPAMRQLAAHLGLDNVTFVPTVPPHELVKRIANADICLGIFGTTGKTQRVVPNKVFQTLAGRKPVITGDTPALREFFEPDVHLKAVPVGDAQALASAIETLADDPALRERLASAGHARVMSDFTVEPLGKLMLDVLGKLT